MWVIYGSCQLLSTPKVSALGGDGLKAHSAYHDACVLLVFFHHSLAGGGWVAYLQPSAAMVGFPMKDQFLYV